MPPRKRPSAAADSNATQSPAKRARKSTTQTAATARPKRFPKLPPRTAKVNATAKPSATPPAATSTPKKRGRPAKSAPSAKDEKPKTKPKAAAAKSNVVAAKTVTGKPKKRLGRPPKALIEVSKKTTGKRKRSIGTSKKSIETPAKKQVRKYTRKVPDVNGAFAHLKEKEPDLTIEVPEDDAYGPEGRSYWLMKAEPESRLVKGVDVKFSIDDLQAATEPEPWDGVRNPVARNNLRAMKQGDYAFFYHSSCKVPGIVGLMEIVREHSVDESAFDPAHPYYDEKSTRENPKWEVVHVEFRRKFDNILPLDKLKSYGTAGKALENLQTLRQSRVSVSRVTPKEWEFITKLIEKANKPKSEAKVETAPEPSAATAPESESPADNKTADGATGSENKEGQQEAQNKTHNLDGQQSNGADTVNGHVPSEPSAPVVDRGDKPRESETNKSIFSLF
ncbi:PUA-like domain-containing protein [Talaromyces proteolyticus]|uniref:Thymocyte nuclear protein 1 n=1 Tax=Talaromyces proteolyticus TaxID=1131652 RepID=A0AAD4KYJ1_9EURO|nr:PUA-like domain-containing protein [Talaromyces proteolyticus]KAH8700185.1 PUA-like domain-containing protein [Talaromyces proteolyticus]